MGIRNVWKLTGPLIALAAFLPTLAAAQNSAPSPACSSFAEAKKLIGTRHCITGKVVRVEHAPDDMTYLDFCEDYRTCPFAVVVFAEDFHHVGSLEPLVGRTVEITGKVKDRDGRAEIVLQDLRQLGGGIRKLPPVPLEFDVEKRGKFSPGTFHATKSRKATRKKATLPSTLDVEGGFED